jgi:hypothetical protein
MNIIKSLQGQKTYGIAILTAMYAIIGYLLGHVDALTAVNMIFAAAGAAGLRSGVTTEAAKVADAVIITSGLNKAAASTGANYGVGSAPLNSSAKSSSQP